MPSNERPVGSKQPASQPAGLRRLETGDWRLAAIGSLSTIIHKTSALLSYYLM